MSQMHEEPNASDNNVFLDAVHCRHLLDQLPESIQIFKEMKNGRGEITGFQVTFSNARAKLMFPERKTGAVLNDAEEVGNASLFFEKLRNVAESGNESNTIIDYVHNGEDVTYKEKILKFEESVLVLIESTDKATDDEHAKANLLRGISETSADILYIMNINTRQLRFTTRNIAKDLGYSEEEIAHMNEPLFDVMHEQDIPAMQLHIENMKTAKPGEVREIEYRLRYADGTLRFYRDRNTVYKTDPDGTPIEKLGISQDTTEDYILQTRRKKHHSILSQCEELSGSGSWEYDRSTTEFIWSDGMYRLFELPKGTPVTPSIYLDYVVPKDKEIAEKLVDVIKYHWESSEFNFRIKTESTTRMLRIKTSAVIENDKHEPEKILDRYGYNHCQKSRGKYPGTQQNADVEKQGTGSAQFRTQDFQ
ncbi:PAS domain-containing protein [Flavobacterium sp. 3HN19-14]|uniref:PAS domain-containing protein n=1 Tax=Flavobacterium sp. 3HN19-14 TaxID=3448133 RepID=UPI003EE0C04E